MPAENFTYANNLHRQYDFPEENGRVFCSEGYDAFRDSANGDGWIEVYIQNDKSREDTFLKVLKKRYFRTGGNLFVDILNNDHSIKGRYFFQRLLEN